MNIPVCACVPVCLCACVPVYLCARRPSSERKYLFNVMAAFTGGRARHLKGAVQAEKLRAAMIPADVEYFVSFTKRSVINRQDTKGVEGYISP